MPSLPGEEWCGHSCWKSGDFLVDAAHVLCEHKCTMGRAVLEI